MNDNSIPRATESEAVLTALLLGPDGSEAVAALQGAGITPTMIYGTLPRAVYEAALALSSKGEEVDLATVTSELREAGKLDGIGGVHDLMRALDYPASLSSLPYHAGPNPDAAQGRARLAAAERIRSATEAGQDIDPADLASISTPTEARPRREVTKYQPFPLEVFPGPVAEWIKQASTSVAVDPSFLALPMLAALGASIGNSRVLRLTDTWTEPPVIWAGVLGESGSRKSPSLSVALSFIHALEGQAYEAFRGMKRQADTEGERYDQAVREWRSAGCVGDPPEEPVKVTCPRITTGDTTMEGLSRLMVENGRGLLLVADELSGWITGFDRYRAGSGVDRAFYLSTWQAAPVRIDRKSEDPTFIPRGFLGITGGLQPGIMRRVLRPEDWESGLVGRFILAMPPAQAEHWRKGSIDPGLTQTMTKVFERLRTLAPSEDETGNSIPREVEFSTEGEVLFSEWMEGHCQDIATSEGRDAAFLSKLKGYCPRLALILCCVREALGEGCGMVTAADVSAAITLTTWAKNEGDRIYQTLGGSQQDRDLNILVEWITQQGHPVTVRDLTHHLRRYRKDPAQAEADLARLVQEGLGRWVFTQGRGRPTREFRLSDTDTTDTDANIQEGEFRQKRDASDRERGQVTQTCQTEGEPQESGIMVSASLVSPLENGHEG